MTHPLIFTALTDRTQAGVLSQRFLFSLLAFGLWLLVFEVHTDTGLDRVEEGLTARESGQWE